MKTLPARMLSLAFGLLLLAVSFYCSRSFLIRPSYTLSSLLLLALIVCFFTVPRLRGARALISRALFSSSDQAFYSTILLVAATCYSWISFKLFQGIPHMDDSVASLFQARIFLSGNIVLPLPEKAEFFELFTVIGHDERLGRWAGMYPPGWPALLAAGALFGVPWIVNPLLGGGLAVVTGKLAEELYNRRVGRVAAIIVLPSPFIGLLSATYLSHTAAAFALVLCCWATVRLMRTGESKYGIIAGGGLGLALLCRPVTAAVVALFIALLPLVRIRRTLEVWRGCLAALITVVVSAALLLGFQYATTGDALTSGHEVVMGPRATLAFGKIDSQVHHSLKEGIKFSIERIRAVNRLLLGWPLVSLFFVAVPFLTLRARAREYWLLLPFSGLLVLFSTFWYFEAYYPGRYLFSAVPFLIVLCALGWDSTISILPKGSIARSFPSILLSYGLLFSVVYTTPKYYASFSPHHGSVENILPQVVKSYDIENALVFMENVSKWKRKWGPRFAHPPIKESYYATGFQLNDLKLKGDVIFARDRTVDGVDLNGELIEKYPNRSYYLYIFFRRSQKGILYRVRVDDDLHYIPVKPHDDLLLHDKGRRVLRDLKRL